MVLARLRKVFESFRERREILPQSSLGKAARYALGQWERLDLWIDDGLIEIDNNLVEKRDPTDRGGQEELAVHRQRGGGTARGHRLYGAGELSAARGRSLCLSADVFTRLPAMTTSQIKDMTPAAWAKARRERAATAPDSRREQLQPDALPLAA